MARVHQTFAQAFDAARARPQDVQRPIEGAYLTSEQAREYLSLPSVGALYWHIRENRLPAVRIGRRYRFRRRDLDAWMARQVEGELQATV